MGKEGCAPAIIIEVAISATTEATSVQTAANSLLGMNPVAIFCSNEGAVTGFLAAVSDGEDLAEGGKYAGLVVAGFDAALPRRTRSVRAGSTAPSRRTRTRSVIRLLLWPSRLPTAKLLKTSIPALSGTTLPTSTTRGSPCWFTIDLSCSNHHSLISDRAAFAAP